MSFQEEIIRVTKDKEVKSQTDSSPAASVDADKPTYGGTEMFNQGLEAASAPEGKLSDVAPEGKAPAPEEKAPAKIRIGSHEFNSIEEATKYANDLELAMIQKEAFDQGKESVQPKEPAVPVKTIEEELEDELFSDPKAALAKYKKHILDEVTKAYRVEKTAEQKAIESKQTRDNTWNKFYTENADLSKSQELVEFVLQKNPHLLELPAESALKELANKTRSYINSARDTQLPTHELQSKGVIAPKGGSPSTPTKQMTTEKAIDFISQVRKLNKNKAAQLED